MLKGGVIWKLLDHLARTGRQPCHQYNLSAALNGDSNFIAVWDSNGRSGTDTSCYSTQGQRLASPIFADGFESGDNIAWSGVQ